jgi:nucleoside-diphosphate-sugar epimerase
VTGGSGFLGRHLLASLSKCGTPVRAVAHRGALDCGHGETCEIVRGDLTDANFAAVAVAGVSHIYHCAGAVSDWARGDHFQAVNVRMLANLLDAARARGVRRLVHVSSTDVYGYTGGHQDETAPLRTTKLGYGDSKVECERLLQTAANASLSIKIVRPSSIYGPYSKSLVLDLLDYTQWPVVPLFGRQVPAGLVEVRDVVTCLHAAMDEADDGFEAYNVCGREPVTWAEYIAALGRLAGQPRTRFVHLPLAVGRAAAAACEAPWQWLPLKGRPPLSRMLVMMSARDQMFPVEKAGRRLQFVPRISLAEGLETLRGWLVELGRIPPSTGPATIGAT